MKNEKKKKKSNNCIIRTLTSNILRDCIVYTGFDYNQLHVSVFSILRQHVFHHKLHKGVQCCSHLTADVLPDAIHIEESQVIRLYIQF